MKARTAISSDAQYVEALLAQLGHPRGIDHAKFTCTYQSALNDENHLILVLEDNDIIIGYVSVRIHSPLYAQDRVAFVDEIVIDETRRGHGAGRQLMQYLEAILQERGCVLCSLATVGSKGFYQNLGYSGHATYLKRSL